MRSAHPQPHESAITVHNPWSDKDCGTSLARDLKERWPCGLLGEGAMVPRVWSGVGDDGMTTAEYAIGTVAACAFAGVLLKLVTSSEVAGLLRDAVRHAFSVAF